ncbi:hypothetical protein FEM48_Zijuj05G0064200 [Ziziphus jujuba var. spinosa]|uniref:Uncharacterized protein n=1 Tax=Ziziphus jujuba var. spinosa TaxID=714518 RepID=A0A978VDC0_ZIZJJ|nr:hypothetical protein FEM48_Zijuj05G0064200 [Ziziphus jujuba var. spinosa]
MLISTLNDVILRCILGQKFQKDYTSGFGELSKRVVVQFTSFKFGDYFPYLRWMDMLTGLVSSPKATLGELDLFLKTPSSEGNCAVILKVAINLVLLQNCDYLGVDVFLVVEMKIFESWLEEARAWLLPMLHKDVSSIRC